MAGVSVEKRGSKWRYRFDASSMDGKRARISKGGFATEKEAMAAGIKHLSEFNSTGVIFTPSEMSYGDYLAEWMEKYCRPNLKPETLVNYEKRIRIHIKPKLGKHKLKNLTAAVMQELINEMFQKGYSRNTLATIRGILSASLDYAVEPMRYIDKNPMVYVRLPSVRAKSQVPTREEPHVYITPEQMERVFQRFPEKTSPHIPLQFGYRCGLRIGEAFAVCWSDIDFDNKKLTISRQIQYNSPRKLWYFTEPKYESSRTIDLDNEMVALLLREKERQERARAYHGAEYRQQYESASRLINTEGDGTPVDLVAVREDGSLISPRVMLHTSEIIHKDLGFPEFDFHSLRHTHTSMMLAAGAPIKYVQYRLGHKRPDVTLRVYQHMTEVVEQNGQDVLDALFKKAE